MKEKKQKIIRKKGKQRKETEDEMKKLKEKKQKTK